KKSTSALGKRGAFRCNPRIVTAISLLVSLPTEAASAVTYRRMGHVHHRALLVALFMGAGSVGGVLLGAAALPAVDKHTLKGILGAVLLLATVCLATPGFVRPSRRRP